MPIAPQQASTAPLMHPFSISRSTLLELKSATIMFSQPVSRYALYEMLTFSGLA